MERHAGQKTWSSLAFHTNRAKFGSDPISGIATTGGDDIHTGPVIYLSPIGTRTIQTGQPPFAHDS